MIGGFLTPVERDVLRILVRGQVPVIIVLARAMQGYRIPPVIKAAVSAGAAQVTSPFPAARTRTTAASAQARNRHILKQCGSVFIAHAALDGNTESLAHEATALGLPLQTLNSPANANLIALGATVI